MVASLGLAIGVLPSSGSGWKPSFEKRFCAIFERGLAGKGRKNVNQPRVEERGEYCPSQQIKRHGSVEFTPRVTQK